ncbi:MAG TPA: DUF58 domain-containing protein, partial [Fluviicola sp.]|nr:DUF58 domain-containing protein [Fluviicola sp.]
IQHLKHNKHEVILFHVTDKSTEINFDFGNQPLHLIDMETGEKMKLQPNEIKEKYTTEITNYFNNIALKCTQFNVDFYPIDIQADLQEVLAKFLLKRQKLY